MNSTGYQILSNFYEMINQSVMRLIRSKVNWKLKGYVGKRLFREWRRRQQWNIPKHWIVLQIFWIECQNVFCDFYYLIVSYALESCSIKPGSVYIQSCRLDGVLCQSSVYDMCLHVSVCRPSTVTSRSTSSLSWPWCTRQNSSWNTTRRSWPPNRSPNYSSWPTTSSPTCPR